VEKNMPGFRAFPIDREYSHRASFTSSLALDDVRVLAENMPPGTEGLKSVLMCLDEARIGIGWGAVGRPGRSACAPVGHPPPDHFS